MPSSLKTFDEFDRLLASARAEVDEEARGLALPSRLRVLRVNPAFRLYQRMGFRVVDSTPERYFMEHSS